MRVSVKNEQLARKMQKWRLVKIAWRLSSTGAKRSRVADTEASTAVLGYAATELHKRASMTVGASRSLSCAREKHIEIENLRSARSASLSGCPDQVTSGQQRNGGKGPTAVLGVPLAQLRLALHCLMFVALGENGHRRK
jgi:hypothetical protein